MKIQRTLPPAAAPLKIGEVFHGLKGLLQPVKTRNIVTQELKDYFNVKHVFLLSSGKAALTVILLALKALSPLKRRVLIPAYTCFSVPSAIVKSGLDIDLCDIDPGNYDYNYELLPDAVDINTLCVITGNPFGIPSDVSKTLEICRDKGIYVVEDAAQAMGCSYKDQRIGTIGDVGFFSLGRGKNITCGSGGIIVTNSDIIAATIAAIYDQLVDPPFLEDAAEFIKALVMSVFISPSLYWFPASLPFLKLGETFFYHDFPVKRLSGMKTGMLKNWRQRLEEHNSTRKGNAEYYWNALKLDRKQGSSTVNASLRLPVIAKNRKVRDNIVATLSGRGLGVTTMYPTAINMIDAIKNRFIGMNYPAAAMMAECLFTVPIHPLLREKDRKKTSALLHELIEASVCPSRSNQRSVPTD